jgi:copper chaperone
MGLNGGDVGPGFKEIRMAKKYRVLGLHCDGCADSVTKAIQATAPKAMVKVDLGKRQITVDGVDDDAIIREAVGNAGFIYAGPA